MGLLDGKVAIITGAGGGLGEAYATLVAREGAAVLVDDPGVLRDRTFAISLPENLAPAVLHMASDLADGQTGKVLAVSSRGVAEIRRPQTPGFRPDAPFTARDVAAHADRLFFPADRERVVSL